METLTIILPALKWKWSNDHRGSTETNLFGEVFKFYYEYNSHISDEDRWCGAVIDKGDQEDWHTEVCDDEDYIEICKAFINEHYLNVVTAMLKGCNIQQLTDDKNGIGTNLNLETCLAEPVKIVVGNVYEGFKFNLDIKIAPETETE